MTSARKPKVDDTDFPPEEEPTEPVEGEGEVDEENGETRKKAAKNTKKKPVEKKKTRKTDENGDDVDGENGDTDDHNNDDTNEDNGDGNDKPLKRTGSMRKKKS